PSPSNRPTRWRARRSARRSRSARSMRRGIRCRASPGPSRWRSAPTRAVAPSVGRRPSRRRTGRSEEHTSELQSRFDLVCRLLLDRQPTHSYTLSLHDALPISFTVQPSNTVAGAAISPAVQVSALDAAGNPVPSFTGTVTVALGTNPGGSTLSGTTTVAAANGEIGRAHV